MPDEGKVCVVAASGAWPFYRLTGAYVSQAHRGFQGAVRLGFYSGRQIHGLVPRIEHVVSSVPADAAHAARLALSADPVERRVGETLAAALHQGPVPDPAQVVLLSRPGDPSTLTITPVTHPGATAWTLFQRYVDLPRLQAATTTGDLANGVA